MDVIEPFVGKYVTAVSASTKIDLDTIVMNCIAVEEEASKINSINSSINSTGGSLTADVLSVGGATVLNLLNECCSSINSVQSDIISETESIREKAIEAYNKIQEQFNDEAEAEEAVMASENSS